MPRWGFSTSPVVENDRLLIEVGGANDNAIVAFNKETGERIWGVATSPSGYSSPILVTVNGVRQALFFARDELLAVSPEDGSVYWRYPWDGGRNSENRVTPRCSSHRIRFSSPLVPVMPGLSYGLSGQVTICASKRCGEAIR